jgi:hypothetical protein
VRHFAKNIDLILDEAFSYGLFVIIIIDDFDADSFSLAAGGLVDFGSIT